MDARKVTGAAPVCESPVLLIRQVAPPTSPWFAAGIPSPASQCLLPMARSGNGVPFQALPTKNSAIAPDAPTSANARKPPP